MFPDVSLERVTRDDVQRMREWLDDPEVNSLWYGLGEDGLLIDNEHGSTVMEPCSLSISTQSNPRCPSISTTGAEGKVIITPNTA